MTEADCTLAADMARKPNGPRGALLHWLQVQHEAQVLGRVVDNPWNLFVLGFFSSRCKELKISCKCCSPGWGGFYQGDSGELTMCYNAISIDSFTLVLTHELTHAWQWCGGWNLHDCRTEACAEAVAYRAMHGCQPGVGVGWNRNNGQETEDQCISRNVDTSVAGIGCTEPGWGAWAIAQPQCSGTPEWWGGGPMVPPGATPA